MKKFLSLSIVLNVALLSVCTFVFFKLGGFDRFLNDKPVSYAEGRVATFSQLEISKDNIVFVGDSITEGGEWNEIFDDLSILNRGINGDFSEGVLNRIDDILIDHPKKIFLLIGINDLAHEIDPDEIEKNYRGIMEKSKKLSPETSIYIQSLLPNNPSAGSKEVPSKDIMSFNKKLQSIANEYGATYVDLFSKFEKENKLNEDLTYDGLHLNANGYLLWSNEIEKYISE